MNQDELIRRLEAAQRKIALMYYIDAERIIEDLLIRLKKETK